MAQSIGQARRIVYIRGGHRMNKGAEAMQKTAVAELSRRLDPDIVLTCRRPLRAPDAIIDISGFAYSDAVSWGPGALRRAEEMKRSFPRARWTFLPQSFGPFLDVRRRERYRRLLGDAMVYARGRSALQHVGALDSSLQCQLSTDITWVFERDESACTKLLESFGVRPGAHLLAIGPNTRVAVRDGGYLRTMKELLLTMRTLGDVIALPHEFRRGARDDRALCRQLDVPFPTRPLPPETLKGLAAQCALYVGSRYHGLLGAVSSGVPILAVGWSEKYDDLLDECGGASFSLSASDVEDSRQRLLDCWIAKEQIATRLKQLATSKQLEVKRLFDDVASEIHDAKQRSGARKLLRVSLQRGRQAKRGSVARHIRLRRQIHRLEKGLCLHAAATVKRPFGHESLTAILKALRKEGSIFEPGTVNWALSVLEQYFRVLPKSPSRAAFVKIRSHLLPTRHYELYPASARPDAPSAQWFRQLSVRRRSIRAFLDALPPRDVIQRCVSVALQAPSACNRQSFRLLYYDCPDLVRQVADIPFGARGLYLPGLFVIVGCYEGYAVAQDIKCPIIDATLAAMTLMLALETENLGTLPINFPECDAFNETARKVCGLADSEFVVMLLGVGFPRPDGLIAASQKRSVDDVLRIVEGPPTEAATLAPQNGDAKESS